MCYFISVYLTVCVVFSCLLAECPYPDYADCHLIQHRGQSSVLLCRPLLDKHTHCNC